MVDYRDKKTQIGMRSNNKQLDLVKNGLGHGVMKRHVSLISHQIVLIIALKTLEIMLVIHKK